MEKHIFSADSCAVAIAVRIEHLAFSIKSLVGVKQVSVSTATAG